MCPILFAKYTLASNHAAGVEGEDLWDRNGAGKNERGRESARKRREEERHAEHVKRDMERESERD